MKEREREMELVWRRHLSAFRKQLSKETMDLMMK